MASKTGVYTSSNRILSLADTYGKAAHLCENPMYLQRVTVWYICWSSDIIGTLFFEIPDVNAIIVNDESNRAIITDIFMVPNARYDL